MRLAQLDRAFGYGPKGRGFESSSARILKKNLTYEILFFSFKIPNKTSKFERNMIYIHVGAEGVLPHMIAAECFVRYFGVRLRLSWD